VRRARNLIRSAIGSSVIAPLLLAGSLGCAGGRDAVGAAEGEATEVESGNEATEQAVAHPALCAYGETIEPYVSFLETLETGPVEYVLGLFETYDVVVLCERSHPEVTQWELIWDITSDERFIDRVGVVFTEYGASSMQPQLDEIMASPDLTDEALHECLIGLMRDMSFWPLWGNQNFFDYLRKLYALNQELPDDKKVRLFLSDIPLDWQAMTKEKLDEGWRKLVWNRDVLMAYRIVTERNRLIEDGSSGKCLVILNYRHAFAPVKNKDGELANNAARYLFEAYPGKVANVLLNTVRPVSAETDFTVKSDLIQDGKWDAAFEVVGNPGLGFDMKDSPFGADSFDLFPFDPAIAALKYEDVFTGFVFYKPLGAQRWVIGVRGLLDDEFVEEVRERCTLAEGTGFAGHFAEFSKNFEADAKDAGDQGVPLNEYVRIQTTADDIPDFRAKLDRWLGDEAM